MTISKYLLHVHIFLCTYLLSSIRRMTQDNFTRIYHVRETSLSCISSVLQKKTKCKIVWSFLLSASITSKLNRNLNLYQLTSSSRTHDRVVSIVSNILCDLLLTQLSGAMQRSFKLLLFPHSKIDHGMSQYLSFFRIM